MNGSARGTALVVLLAGVPALACSMLLAARGSAAAVLTWLGSAGFLLYNSLMFVFATPANRLFPLYLAMLALAAWSAGALLRQADVAALGALFSPRTPARGIAVYIWATVAPERGRLAGQDRPGRRPRRVARVPARHRAHHQRRVRPGSGAVAAVAGVAAAWLWRRRPWGYLLAGAGLVMWVLESASIAVDQWYGHAAAPARLSRPARSSPRSRCLPSSCLSLPTAATRPVRRRPRLTATRRRRHGPAADRLACWTA